MEKKTYKKKILMKKNTRYLLRAASLVLMGISLVWSIKECNPETTVYEKQMYSYEVVTDSSYRVHLIENELYKEEWLGEGGIYAENLTDYIEVVLKSGLTGSGEAYISGNYEVTAVIEGYRVNGETRKTVFEKQFPLNNGLAVQKDLNQASIEQVCEIYLQPYQDFIQLADQILGVGTAKDFYILFSGSFAVDTEFGSEEKQFTHKVFIPLGDSLYEIRKQDKEAAEGVFKEIIREEGTVELSDMFLAFVPGICSVIFIFFSIWGGRKPTEAENNAIKLKSILRKYAGRMVLIKQMPVLDGKECIVIQDIENLLLLGEELHRPVLYCLDENGFPKEGKFCVTEGENAFLFLVEPDTTTLVVDHEEESSKENAHES